MTKLVILVATVTLLSCLHVATARACGACLAPQATETSVDSHRMMISLSTTRTILWDQIRYSGNPADFAWVLPVPSADTSIEVVDELFFDELEWQTGVQVLRPVKDRNCPPNPSGGIVVDGGALSAADGGVEVYREEVVGPYQVAVIGSDNGGELFSWLIDNGYHVPELARPTLSYYVNQKSKFIALRLAPEQGVGAMQPVRIEYPGYMSTFPLKMVTVGARGLLKLTLWVVAEQRYEARNYGTVAVDPAYLVWDYWTNQSNYPQLFRDAIDGAGGKAWVVEHAGLLSNLIFSDFTEAGHASSGITAPYLTRVRTEQLVEHLTEDLQLGPAADASDVSRQLTASLSVNDCPDYNGDGKPDTWADYRSSGCSLSMTGGGGAAVILLGLLALALVRRRRRA